LNPNISRQAEDIILRALRRKPAQRYASAAAMKADLDHPERMTVIGLSDRLEPVTRWRRWRRMARYVATVAILPVVVQVVLFGLLWHHFARKK
jgi:serine/threonine protein kinase